MLRLLAPCRALRNSHANILPIRNFHISLTDSFIQKSTARGSISDLGFHNEVAGSQKETKLDRPALDESNLDGSLVPTAKKRTRRKKQDQLAAVKLDKDGLPTPSVKKRYRRTKEEMTIVKQEEALKKSLKPPPITRKRRRSREEMVQVNQDKERRQQELAQKQQEKALKISQSPPKRRRIRRTKEQVISDEEEQKHKSPDQIRKKLDAVLEELQLAQELQLATAVETRTGKANQPTKVKSISLCQTGVKIKNSLFTNYGGWARKGALGDIRRINIVNPGLCDDVIERIKPSLLKHIGCDIIDINPGACLWSSKLHDFLKPRTHILMEPDKKMYKSFLDPLLKAENSKYVHYPKPGVVWTHLEALLRKENLPHQEPLSPNDSRIEQPNNTLLLIANLAYHPKKPFRGFPSLTVLVLHQLMTAMRSHSLIHKYGHVRMLIWLSDEERIISLPRNVTTRKKGAIEAELSCETITEIASSTTLTHMPRDLSLDVEVLERVMKKMGAAGITTPRGRESDIQKHKMGLQEGKGTLGVPRRASSRELAYMRQAFAAGQFDEFAVKHEEDGDRTIYSDEFQRLRELEWKEAYMDSQDIEVSTFVRRHESILEMQREASNSGNKESDLEIVAEATKEFLADAVKIKAVNTRGKLMAALDNNRILRCQDPPALLFDRREVEPLKVHPVEFFPRKELALLDFQPKPLVPILRKDYPANYDVAEYILMVCFLTPTLTVKESLKSLWPGAYEWLITDCPSLFDPSKGGDFNLDNITIRSLPTKLFIDIFESWDRWPFKPSRYELLARSSVYQSAEYADEVDEKLG